MRHGSALNFKTRAKPHAFFAGHTD